MSRGVEVFPAADAGEVCALRGGHGHARPGPRLAARNVKWRF
jgi:hypothetical protein